MRLFLACFLAACGGPVDDVIPTEGPDATFPTESGVHFVDAAPLKEAEAGPVYVGGPLACGKCTCDGLLYTCLQGVLGPDGGCSSGGPPPPPPPPESDASLDADASDATSDAMTCGGGRFCSQIPIGCLPKPTCECIEQTTGMLCTVAPNGSGFLLVCP